MRVGITGATGLLGSNLLHLSPQEWEIVGLTHTYPVSQIQHTRLSFVQGDLVADAQAACTAFDSCDVIVHTAALTNVDQCEEKPDIAHSFHVTATSALAQHAKKIGAHFIHISTDHIFDGERGDYAENDVPAPCNVYAQTKLDAESAVEQVGGPHTIIRTNFFGYNLQQKTDLAGWMVSTLKKGQQLRLFTDARFSPILANVLVECIQEIVTRGIFGLFHIGSRDGCSKYEFGMRLASVLGYDTSHIKPVSIDEVGFRAVRPKDLTLNTSHAQRVLDAPLPTVEESIAQYAVLARDGYQASMRQMLSDQSHE
jgi:dTDP-4-dehydrorhamnose reductase